MVAAIAMKVGHPVRWIEDRREHLIASVHARDHFYDLTISANKDGTLTFTSAKKGEEAKDVSYKVADEIKTTVMTGGEKKELAAKDALGRGQV